MFHALAMFHMSANVPCFVGCSTRRRVFYGDAPSRGRHCLSNPSLRGPSDLGNPNSFSDLSKLGSRGDRSNPSSFSNPNSFSSPNSLSLSGNSNRSNYSSLTTSAPPATATTSATSDYSSEASSFIPSSIRDLSRNEKLSLIVLRWLPSG